MKIKQKHVNKGFILLIRYLSYPCRPVLHKIRKEITRKILKCIYLKKSFLVPKVS